MDDDKSYDTGFVPERPGSAILIRRYYDAKTGVGGYEEKIPFSPIKQEQILAAFEAAKSIKIGD
jgi:hypothetical protein